MQLLKLIKKDDIGEPPWAYDFLVNLDENEYPKYLKKIFKYRTGEDLPLKRERGGKLTIDKNKCKTFNQKIQWLKLYGATQLMRDCTDKVKVRDFVRECIGEEYLKPVLQIIPYENSDVAEKGECSNYNAVKRYDVENYFDQIDFDKLSDSFIIKCNHGCKWHFIVEDKADFLKNKRLQEVIKRQMTGWLEQEFWPWEGFEMQYKGIEPKILIEPYMPASRYMEIYCFDGVPQIYLDVHQKDELKICTYNGDFSYSDLVLKKDDKKFMDKFCADDILKQAGELSKQLACEFKFVRVDWMIYDKKLYFEELTFTTYSGFTPFDKEWNLKLGSWIDLDYNGINLRQTYKCNEDKSFMNV